ncbi:unnamed protein product [Pleuronectes platessa]|uniref:Uncharacterized protein n=1 Tax=Pleuronectes platessa TaxID=8262 RepID=A0A9N7YR37_PLEPL|nr:unnamed protein product [Pleuronectes platessa]
MMVNTKAQKAAQQNSTTSKLPASTPQAKASSAAASMEAASEAAAEEGSMSRLRSVFRVIEDDFYEARIEACVDDVCDDVRSLASRPSTSLIQERVRGFEKAEGNDMCAFLEKWPITALSTDTFPTPPIIERAHRIGRLKASSATDSEREHQSEPLVVPSGCALSMMEEWESAVLSCCYLGHFSRESTHVVALSFVLKAVRRKPI